MPLPESWKGTITGTLCREKVISLQSTSRRFMLKYFVTEIKNSNNSKFKYLGVLAAVEADQAVVEGAFEGAVELGWAEGQVRGQVDGQKLFSLLGLELGH